MKLIILALFLQTASLTSDCDSLLCVWKDTLQRPRVVCGWTLPKENGIRIVCSDGEKFMCDFAYPLKEVER
jgi:hypothetical protein